VTAEVEKERAMKIIVMRYRDQLGIDRVLVESEKSFERRCDAAEIGAAEIEERAAALEQTFPEELPVAIDVEESEYTLFSHAKFATEAAEAGLEVERYRGRCYYDGPAVRADSADEVLRYVTVRCQQDSMGLGVIVYPSGG
jgi:hypothetical protein